MKQTLTAVSIVALGSAIFVALMWAPFTYALTGKQVMKYALIGGSLGFVFYLVAVRKGLPRRKNASKALPFNSKPGESKQQSKKAR